MYECQLEEQPPDFTLKLQEVGVWTWWWRIRMSWRMNDLLIDLWYKNTPEDNGNDNVESHRDFTSKHGCCLAPFGAMCTNGEQYRKCRHDKTPFTFIIY
jgi:hypothetical protein